ncbi:hypothetical protein ACHWQZ_G014267 [Mnemiopsis leidyi]
MVGHSVLGQENSGAQCCEARCHWDIIPGTRCTGAGGQWGPRLWGKMLWGTTLLGHNPWGTVYWGRRLVGQAVVGQAVVGHDVTGALSLGQSALGQDVSGAQVCGARGCGARRHWGIIPGAKCTGAGVSLSLIAPKRAVVVPDIIRDGCKSLNSLKKRTNCQSPEKNRFVLISFRFKSDSLMLKSESLINDEFNRQ